MMKPTFLLAHCCSLLMLAAPAVGIQEIALTFDDAPRAAGPVYTGMQRTEVLIQKLQEAQVERVAFFAVSSRIDDEGRERLEAYGSAGHIIGNHTHSHARIHRLGREAYIQDIFKADAAIKGITGFRRWFRYPFLDEGRTRTDRDAIRQALASGRYINAYVTVDNFDWYIDNLFKNAHRDGHEVDMEKLRSLYLDHIWQSIVFYDRIAARTLNRSPRHVLLLHENDLAALFIEDLVGMIRRNGWRIITPDEAYQDPIADSVPDVLMNNQGRIAALAKASGFEGPLSQASEDMHYLDQRFGAVIRTE